MKKQLTPVFCLGRVLAMAWAVPFLAPTGAFGLNAYLSTVGPPAIRIDAALPRGIVVPTEFSYDDTKPKPAVAPTLVTVSTNQTELASQPVLAQPIPEPSPLPATSPNPPTPAPNNQRSVQDINIVTPQMLMDFLRPGIGSPVDGKGPALFYPGKFDFTPPVEINRSSTAVYKKE